MLNCYWDEKHIRQELIKLDAKTRLSGATLPIYFNNSKYTLGKFCSANGGEFIFSNYYFQNPEWSKESALDVIRHEYAHYMDYKIYGHLGHSKTWKRCCLEVGALPIRCYNSEHEEYYQKKHKVEEAQKKACNSYIPGIKIIHPTFGCGVILQKIGEDVNSLAIVRFNDSIDKKLSLAWIHNNCIVLNLHTTN